MTVTNQRLRHVLALAEHRNFARAADALHITQPALSRSILTLEKAMGARLFDRLSRGIEPTAFGEVVARRAVDILERVSEMEREIDLMKGREVGEVVVGAGPIVAASHMGRAIGHTSNVYPLIRVIVRVDSWGALANSLQRGQVDVFVGEYTEALDNPAFAVTPMAPRRFVFFARAGHPLMASKHLSLAQLQQFPLAAPRVPVRIQELLRGQNPGPGWWGGNTQPDPAIECESYPVIKSIVASSDAISAAPSTIIADEVRDGILVPLRVPTPDLQTRYGIVVRSNRTLSPAAAAFIEHVVAADEAFSQTLSIE